MSQVSETTSLLPKGEQPKTFYFLSATEKPSEKSADEAIDISTNNVGEKSYFSWLVSTLTGGPKNRYQVVGKTVLKTRMVPVKVEPKVFFANERTFLAWLHMSVTLAAISVGIVA